MRKKFLFLLTLTILTTSCQLIKQKSPIEAQSSSTSFEFKRSWEARGGDMIKMMDAIMKGDEYKNIKKNAYLFNVDLSLKNNTEERIEEGAIKIIIKLDYPNKTVNLSLRERKLYDEIPSYWNPGQTINYSDYHFLNIVDDFKPELFDHQPEKVEMDVYISIKNSVGLDLEEQIISNKDITDSWKNINI